MKESDLYPPVKQWLEEQGFEVYPEVTNDWGRVDVVGVLRCPGASYDKSVAVELKTSLSVDLVDQCIRASRYANQTYAAVPTSTRERKNLPLLERHRVGLLSVDPDGVLVDLYCKPRIPTYRNLATRCFKEYQTQDIQGGHFGGGYLTPKKILLGRVKAYLIKVGKPVSVRQIMDNIEMVGTHYSSRDSATSVVFSHLVLCEHAYAVRDGWGPDWVEVVRAPTGRNVFFQIKEGVTA